MLGILIQLPYTSSLPFGVLANVSSEVSIGAPNNETFSHPLPSQTFSSPAHVKSLWRTCATPEKWSRRLFIQPEDCQSAVQWLFLEEVFARGTPPREFLSVGAERTTQSIYELTPRKYTFGKRFYLD